MICPTMLYRGSTILMLVSPISFCMGKLLFSLTPFLYQACLPKQKDYLGRFWNEEQKLKKRGTYLVR